MKHFGSGAASNKLRPSIRTDEPAAVISDLQKAVGDVPRIPMQIQCDERSLWRRDQPRVKPDAVGGEQPDIFGF